MDARDFSSDLVQLIETPCAAEPPNATWSCSRIPKAIRQNPQGRG